MLRATATPIAACRSGEELDHMPSRRILAASLA
jgi:hypothetical protein